VETVVSAKPTAANITKPHLVVDLIRLARQAVEELPIRVGPTSLAQVLGDLVALERLETLCLFCLLSHRDPSVRDDKVCAMYGLLRVARPVNTGLAVNLANTIPDDRRRLVLVRSGDSQLVAKTRVCDHHVVQDVGAVTDVRNCKGRDIVVAKLDELLGCQIAFLLEPRCEVVNCK